MLNKSSISQVLIRTLKKIFWIPIGTFILEFLVALNPTISQSWVKIVYRISCILYMMHMYTIHDAHVVFLIYCNAHFAYIVKGKSNDQDS